MFSNHYVILDLETVALPDAAEYLEPVDAPSNYKDQAKIDAYVAEAQRKQIDKAACDIDLARIVCLGWMRGDEDEPLTVICHDLKEERQAIGRFWFNFETNAFVGYNLLAFDLPLLARRSWYLGIPPPVLNLDRYRTPHIDLQQKLTHNGLLKWRSLDFYVRRFGLDVPDDPHEGKDIAALVAADDWSAVAHHCRCDVVKVALLARRVGLLSPVQEPAGVL